MNVKGPLIERGLTWWVPPPHTPWVSPPAWWQAVLEIDVVHIQSTRMEDMERRALEEDLDGIA